MRLDLHGKIPLFCTACWAPLGCLFCLQPTEIAWQSIGWVCTQAGSAVCDMFGHAAASLLHEALCAIASRPLHPGTCTDRSL